MIEESFSSQNLKNSNNIIQKITLDRNNQHKIILMTGKIYMVRF